MRPTRHMQPAEALEVFNRKLLEFAEDLRTLRTSMPHIEVPALDTLRPTINLALTMDPKSPIRMFHDMVATRFGQRILDRDERFFMEEAAYSGAHNIDLVAVLKQMWGMLAAADKDAIWSHLHVLVLLDRAYTDGLAAAAAAAKTAST